MNSMLNKLLVLFFLIVLCGGRPVLAADRPLDLFDCYHLALKQSETVAVQKELITEAEARFIQSLSGILPKVSYVYSERRQDGTGSTNFQLREVPEGRFTLSQPLFSGFKEFAAMAAARAEGRQREHEMRRAEQLLFTDVSDAFYLLLGYREELETLDAIKDSLRERVQELTDRAELGRARRSEVAMAESRLSRIEADLEEVRSDEEVARHLLEFLTGTEIVQISDTPVNENNLSGLDNYLKRRDGRPDVAAAKEALTSARKQVAVARAGYWPTVSADGNYYTKRIGNSAGVDWDATLTVEAPLFQGGATYGLVKEEKSQARQAQLAFRETERLAELDIRDAYSRAQSAFRRSRALEKSVEATEKNYQYQKEDYNLNLVNNLQVLQALEDLETARRDFITAKNEARRDYWNLQIAVGELPEPAAPHSISEKKQ